MKQIILSVIVADEDAEAIVKAVKKHLPTWDIEIIEQPEGE